LKDLIPFIDWSPFFHTWELRGRYPAIFDDPSCGTEAKKLFDDAQKLLAEIVAEDSLQLRGVCGIFPANRDGLRTLLFIPTNHAARSPLASTACASK
jgi:5-methyltetrahydrofolate--homocysteine methyltransferase